MAAKQKKEKNIVVSSQKKRTMMNPIWHRMKKCNPFSGHNDQLVHWWLLVHSTANNVLENMPINGYFWQLGLSLLADKHIKATLRRIHRI